MTDVNEAVKTAAMQAFESFKSEIAPKLSKLDGFDAEKIVKLEKTMGDALELQQKSDAERKAMADTIKALEVAVTRPTQGKDDNKETEAKTKNAFGEFMRKGAGSDRGDFADFIERKGLDVKALSVNINQDGGFLVPSTLGGIVNVRIFETSPVRQLATVVPISTAEYEIVLDNDEAAANWIGETGTRAVSNTPTLDKRIIPTHEMFANPLATQKILDDAVVDMESWLASKVADKFARTEATAFVSGNGVAKPIGILAYTTTSTSYDPRNVQVVNSGTQGQFTYAGIANVQNALKEVYQANATFMVRRSAFGAILNIRTGISGDNRPIFNMMYDKNAGIAFSIMGRPVVFADDVPAVANDVNAMIYGDFRAGYTVVDRIGLRVLRDPFTSKPYVSFYTTKRVGGDVVNAEAFKILALSN